MTSTSLSLFLGGKIIPCNPQQTSPYVPIAETGYTPNLKLVTDKKKYDSRYHFRTVLVHSLKLEE